MARMVKVSVWGRNLPAKLPEEFKVLVDEFYDAADAASRSIERRTGLTFATWRSDGTALRNNEPVADHYVGTLAKPLRSGGYLPISEVWVSIPRKKR